MAKVHRRIGTPIAIELALSATGLDVDAAATLAVPASRCLRGAPVTIFGRYRGTAAAGAAIDVRGHQPRRGDAPHGRARRERGGGAVARRRAGRARRFRDLEDRYAAAQ